MLTDKIAQKLAPIYLSDISQEDAYQILVRSLDATSWTPFYSFSHCITDAVCGFYRTNRASVLKIRNDLWDKLKLDGCYIVEGEALEELKRTTHQDFAEYLEVTFWTPRAMLRLATELTNPRSYSLNFQP
jgi:hypothetical protein